MSAQEKAAGLFVSRVSGFFSFFGIDKIINLKYNICMAHVYLISGLDEYKKKIKLRELINSFHLTLPEFNLRSLGSENTVSEIIMALETLPMMDSVSVTIVNDFPNDAGNLLYHYLEKIPDFSALIIVCESADKRKALYKQIAKLGTISDNPAPSIAELSEFCRSYLKQNGSAVSLSASQELSLRFSDKYTLKNEMDKLLCVCGDEITVSDVQKYSSQTLEYNIFNLNKLLIANDFAKALPLYQSVYVSEKSPFGVLGLLSVKLKNMLFARQMLDANYSDSQISKHLGYSSREAIDGAKKYSARRLRQNIVEMAKLDFELKSGIMDMYLGSEYRLIKIYQTS